VRIRRSVTGTAVAVILAGCLAVPVMTPAAAVSGSCVTSQLQPVPGSGTSLAGSTPVVFIHGIISSASMWKASTPGAIAYQAARMSGATAWTFNYGPDALDWVTNPAIGPAFASRLACLARYSGHSVIVVGHSMGGLATQYAVAQPDPYGGTVGDHVGAVITIGTPYQGSELLTAMQLARAAALTQAILDPSQWPEAALGEAVLSACAGHTSGICALPAVLTAPVGTDLELYSGSIAALPLWPTRLPVLDIAGDMGLLIGVGHVFVVHRFDVGDVAVTMGSATAHNTMGAPIIKLCNSLTLLGAVYGDPGPCFHTHLVNDGDIISDVLNAIRAELPTSYSSYLGRFYAHDYELCIGQALDMTSATAASNPPCGGNGTSGWERMWGCGYPSGGCGFAWIALRFTYHADGTVTATPSSAPVPVPGPVGGSFYDDGLTVCTLNAAGNIVPCNAGVTGIPPEGLTPGSQQLSLVSGGVLKVTLPQGYWGGASYEVCGQSASQAAQQQYCPNG
jgi:pimeloyl-ACP methyl ester carboxylesterase